MKEKKILHVLAFDKFCKPFINYINKEFDNREQTFLCATKPDDEFLASHPNVKFLHSPYRSNILRNVRIFKKCVSDAGKIILHGNPGLFYFCFFPSAIRKIYWVILGYELGESSNAAENKQSNSVHSRIKNFVLRRVRGHISHIEGDSALANVQQHSNAPFFYSPIYLSNVVPERIVNNLAPTPGMARNILVGNSTSDTNDHFAIFDLLKPYKDDDIIVHCPLSYGDYNNYRDAVIEKGTTIFGNKFMPLTTFMNADNYNEFLSQIDIAIFNHKRQEAMGVTLALLSMGKVVYMNCGTTAFRSLNERGIRVFDNGLIKSEGLFEGRDVRSNPERVYQNYSLARLKESWANVFNN